METSDWKIISYEEKDGWVECMKVMRIEGAFFGSLVKFSVRYRNPDGSYSVSETMTYVPGATF